MQRARGLVLSFTSLRNVFNSRSLYTNLVQFQQKVSAQSEVCNRMGQSESKRTMSSGYTTNEADQRAAKETRDAGASGKKTTLENIADVPRAEIDDGLQKYVLVKVQDEGGKDHWFVRGNCGAAYHNDAATPLVRLLEDKGVYYDVVGGGRILHDAAAKSIKVYGHSYGFPWAGGEYQHDKSCEVLREKYTDYKSSDIFFENEGY